MKYIVVEIQTNAGNAVSFLNTQYDNRNDAESAYHSILAAAAISQLPTHAAVLMTNEGFVIESKYYNHEVA